MTALRASVASMGSIRICWECSREFRITSYNVCYTKLLRAIDFNDVFNKAIADQTNGVGYSDPLRENEEGLKPNPAIMSVVVDKIVRDDSAPKMKYDPSHPDADANGYVAYPNINPVIEMADLVEATRSYQANVAAFESVITSYSIHYTKLYEAG